MSHQNSAKPQLWVITGSSWTGTGQPAEKDIKSPFAVEDCIPDGQMATLSLDPSEAQETIDLGENHFEESPPPYKLQIPKETSTSSAQCTMAGTCRDHGGQLSLFCCQEHKLICHQCKSHGMCQSHKTKPMEERASQLRVSA